jgi:hypothetical protein
MLQCGCGGVRSERVEAAAERRSVRERERRKRERECEKVREKEHERLIFFFFLSFVFYLFYLVFEEKKLHKSLVY